MVAAIPPKKEQRKRESVAADSQVSKTYQSVIKPINIISNTGSYVNKKTRESPQKSRVFHGFFDLVIDSNKSTKNYPDKCGQGMKGRMW